MNCNSERRILKNKRRRQQELRKNILLAIMGACLVIILSFGVNSFLSNAKSDSRPAPEYYKSVTIAKNDTLWSIAEEYMDEEHYNSVKDYIDEVMRINSLSSDVIKYGENIIVPYY